MDKAIARHSVQTAFHLCRTLTDHLDLLRDHTTDANFEDIKIRIAEAIDKINVALINPSVSAFPDLNYEIEKSLDKYGRYI